MKGIAPPPSPPPPPHTHTHLLGPGSPPVPLQRQLGLNREGICLVVCVFFVVVFTSSLKSKPHDVFDDTTFCGMFSDCSRADRKHVTVEST